MVEKQEALKYASLNELSPLCVSTGRLFFFSLGAITFCNIAFPLYKMRGV